MPMTLMDSDFFEKVMAKSRKPDEGYKIKDPPKEYGIGLWEFLKMLGKALAVAYAVSSFLRIFA